MSVSYTHLGAAHIVDVALELGVVGERLRLAHDAVVASHLQNAPLMEGERAEAALTKAAAVARYGEEMCIRDRM